MPEAIPPSRRPGCPVRAPGKLGPRQIALALCLQSAAFTPSSRKLAPTPSPLSHRSSLASRRKAGKHAAACATRSCFGPVVVQPQHMLSVIAGLTRVRIPLCHSPAHRRNRWYPLAFPQELEPSPRDLFPEPGRHPLPALLFPFLLRPGGRTSFRKQSGIFPSAKRSTGRRCLRRQRGSGTTRGRWIHAPSRIIAPQSAADSIISPRRHVFGIALPGALA